jgi:hypothetical protein
MSPHSLSTTKLDPNKSRLNFYQQNTSTPVTIDTSHQSFITFPPSTSSPLPPPPLPTKQPPPIMPKPSSQALLANQNKKTLQQQQQQQQDPRGGGEQYKIETLKSPPKVLSTAMPLNSGAGGGGDKMWQKTSSLENLDGFIDIDDGGETEQNEVTPSNLSKYNYEQQQQQQTRYLKEQEEHFSQHEVTTQEIRQMYERKNIILTTPVVNPNNNNNNNNNRKLNTTNVRRSAIFFSAFCLILGTWKIFTVVLYRNITIRK